MEFKTIKLVFILLFFHCLLRVTVGKKLIVVLVDGLRWDYINDSKLKGFQQIMNSGVRAPYVMPVFPSLSYPNYQSIATGLYPENHGFVSNHLYDNSTDTVFNMIPKPGSDAPHWWNDAEPIWITAEKNGQRSALYWWAGCEVEIWGGHPTICERQMDFMGPTPEGKTDFLERVDDLVELFKSSKRFATGRMSLAMMYYGSVDYEGHGGTKTDELKNALKDIDEILDKMQSKLKKASLSNEVNIMVVSDHGMTDTKGLKKINLKKFASMIKHQLDYSVTSMIVPQPGMLDKLYQEIVDDKIEGLEVYKKEDIPEKYHLKKSSKTSPLLLIAKKGYQIESLNGNLMSPGTHGYDPEEVPDMRSVFLATGPDFKRKYTTYPLNIVDLYNIMCHVLQIHPLPNNGSWEHVKSMFPGTPEHMAVENSSGDTRCFLCALLLTTCISLLFSMHFKFL